MKLFTLKTDKGILSVVYTSLSKDNNDYTLKDFFKDIEIIKSNYKEEKGGNSNVN